MDEALVRAAENHALLDHIHEVKAALDQKNCTHLGELDFRLFCYFYFLFYLFVYIFCVLLECSMPVFHLCSL